jgi:alkylhydroperoxidase family enzyme
VRFAVAKQDGLTEDLVEQIRDGYESSNLPVRHQRALRFADALLNLEPLSAVNRAELQTEFTDAQVAELGIGLALFHGFSKVLIASGAEPDQMDTTVIPTPDVV